MIYVSILENSNTAWRRYKFMDLDSAYNWLSNNKWHQFTMRSNLAFGYRDDEFEVIK